MKTFLSVLVLMLSVGVAQAGDGIVYSESVTATVAGSSPTNTYSADVAELCARLEAAVSALRSGEKSTIVLTRQSALTTDISNAAAKLRTNSSALDTAINGLGFYAQKGFYDTAPAGSKAAEDQGKHASWILRMVVPGGT